MEAILDFSKPASNRPIVENLTVDSIAKALFANQYTDALTMLNKYLSTILDETNPSFHEQFATSVTDSNNNILAFVGERGTGKTSCMLSLASLLLEDKRRKNLSGFDKIQSTPFFHVGMIDPSFFDQEHNILSLFLAKMYQCYQKWIQTQDEAVIDQDIQGELMESFCSAQRHLNFMLDKQTSVQDDLDRLIIFSASTDLKTDIYDLIESYKKLRKYDKESKLLLIVDDIDLNVGEGSRMAELIRKYFVQPNIVVLMSVKMEQLSMVKKQDFVAAYNYVLNEKLLKTDTIEEMAERYLAKFIPQAHRIFMPLAENLYQLPVKLNEDATDSRNGQPCMAIVCEEIFQKTRYLFYNSPYNVNSIVPNNLRELGQLLTMLNNLPYYRDKDGEHLYNKTLFKQYLTEDWVANHICLKHREIVIEILKEDQLSLFNNKVVKMLKQQYNEILKQANTDPEITNILDDANVVYNISVGDVLAVIYYLSTRCVTEYDQQLFFFLRSLYSIRLYEAYDIMTDSIDGINRAEKTQTFVLSEEEYKHLSEYDKLVGGILVNTRITPLLSTTNIKGEEVNLAYQLIESRKLKELFDMCNTNWDEAFVNGSAQLLEFLLLCIYRDANSVFSLQDIGNFKSYRKESIVAFDRILESGSYVFDLGALMFNITRVEECYKRFSFGTTVWKNAERNRGSLYNQMKIAMDGSGELSLHKWKSNTCIRNIEILDKFVKYIRQSISSYGKNLEETEDFQTLYEMYFEMAANFKIESYDCKPMGNERYTIRFDFYNAITALFEKVYFKEYFMTMFFVNSDDNAFDSSDAEQPLDIKGI